MITNLRIQGEPTPKGRPRFSVIRGKVHAYTPEKTRAAEEEMRWHLRSAMKGAPVTHPVSIRVEFRCTRKSSDADNLLKLVMDSAQGIVFENDRQIVQIEVDLHRVKSDPHTVITFREVEPMEAAA